jgi:hypothetical protein
MDLRPYVEDLRVAFAVAAEGADPGSRALTERLSTQLEAATRLMLLNALSDAADEITSELAPGSVNVQLRGREPSFVVHLPEPTQPTSTSDEPGDATLMTSPVGPVASSASDSDAGGVARISLRLPEQLKVSVEEAAAKSGLSVNAWLVRAISAAVAAGAGNTVQAPVRSNTGTRNSQRITGWVR